MKYFIYGLLVAMGGIFAGQAEAQNSEPKTAIFAAGCFWCVEKDFEHVKGVSDVVSGYTGGQNSDPTYQNHPGHYEAVKITYDPSIVSYSDLLDVFWSNHDPFDAKGQFCDKGTSYLAAIFPLDDSQKDTAQRSLRDVQKRTSQKIVTPIIDADTFYPAEDYHQDYYKKNALKYKFYRWNCGRDQRLEQVKDIFATPSDM